MSLRTSRWSGSRSKMARKARQRPGQDGGGSSRQLASPGQRARMPPCDRTCSSFLIRLWTDAVVSPKASQHDARKSFARPRGETTWGSGAKRLSTPRCRVARPVARSRRTAPPSDSGGSPRRASRFSKTLQLLRLTLENGFAAGFFQIVSEWAGSWPEKGPEARASVPSENQRRWKAWYFFLLPVNGRASPEERRVHQAP